MNILTKSEWISFGFVVLVLGTVHYNFEPKKEILVNEIKEYAVGETYKCLSGKDLGYKFPTCEYYVSKYGKDVSNYASIRAKLVSFFKH